MPTTSADNITISERQLAARYLCGSGIEIGAGHRSVRLDEGFCNVRYVDRLKAAEIRARFPELKGKRIVPTEVVYDVAKEGLAPFADESLDFVIACHLLEHLSNPLGFLKECHRVLRSFGIFYLAVPDKDYTFDKGRRHTPLTHLIEDLEKGTTEVSEEHLIDFLVHAAGLEIPQGRKAREGLFQRELGRGIHVHVWRWRDVVRLLKYMLINEGVTWELCEAYLPKGITNEAIFILRKTNLNPELAIQHFNRSLKVIIAREQAMEILIRRSKIRKKRVRKSKIRKRR